MKYYSDYTKQYVSDICDALNDAEIYKMLHKHDQQADRPFAPENFETLTDFLQNYVVIPMQIFSYLNDKGLVNKGKCPYTGQRIDTTFPKWSYMNTRSVYVSHEGAKIMKKEFEDDFEKVMGEPAPQIKSGGCYIATVCYGSEFAKEVIILKSYRDEVLSKSMTGRVFIQIYYLLSPMVAKLLQNKISINTFVRTKILDKIIYKIKKR